MFSDHRLHRQTLQDSAPPPATASEDCPPSTRLQTWLAAWSLTDWLSLSYLLVFNLLLIGAEPGPQRVRSALWGGVLFGLFVTLTLVLGRTQALRNTWWRALCYRLGHLCGVQLSYFALAEYLPAVNPRSLDTQLYELDLWLFGAEPAMLLERFVTPATTEWFAFFYYSYFFLLISHVVPIVFFSRNARLLGEFAFGMVFVTAVGHLTYTLVPGYGPHRAFADAFSQPLPDGLWWGLVLDLVNQGGAQKDIFPSLHTAIPTFLLLHSYHNRHAAPFRITWPVVAFATVNIIIATMFLRWHYFIDVLAGLALAATAHRLSSTLVPSELHRRQQRALPHAWPPWTEPASLPLASGAERSAAPAREVGAALTTEQR